MSANAEPRPPVMTEEDCVNMITRAVAGIERENKKPLIELAGRVLHNIERIADALERSSDALSAEPVKALFEADRT
jgi:hypothetical protein